MLIDLPLLQQTVESSNRAGITRAESARVYAREARSPARRAFTGADYTA
jgi:hypothetical protein